MTVERSVFSDRRARFAEALGEGVAIVTAASETLRNQDVEFPFRQDSDFYFLTGFDEPEAVALFDPSNTEEQYLLFVRPRDREKETWTGRRAGSAGAQEQFGPDAAYEIKDFEAQLRERLLDKNKVYVRSGDSGPDGAVSKVVERLRRLHTRTGRTAPFEVHDPSPLLAELRLRKTPEEVAVLREACQISVEGHKEAMRFAAPGRYEYQVGAALEYVFRAKGSPRNSFPSIVAAGPNAGILHYTSKNRALLEGELLLVDAGAEFGYQSADITRTFPVSGRFTSLQREIYAAVLAAHTAATALCIPGGTLKQAHDAAKRVISEALVSLGLVPLGLDATLSMHHYREFFMHGTSHWLGIDVHDVGTYRVQGEPRVLETGMAFTIEPGIYIPSEENTTFPLLEYDVDEWFERRVLLGEEAARKLEEEERDQAEKISHPIPEGLRGIGVRIEDDLVITPSGHENLSLAVPADPEEIEDLCAEAPSLPLID